MSDCTCLPGALEERQRLWGTRSTCQAHLAPGVQGRGCRAQCEREVPEWGAPSTQPTHHLAGHPAVREVCSQGSPCGQGRLRGTPVLMLGLLENSRPRGQRTGGNPSRGLHCKAKGVPLGPGSPLRARQGVNDGGLPHSQAAIQLVTTIFKYSSSSFW